MKDQQTNDSSQEVTLVISPGTLLAGLVAIAIISFFLFKTVSSFNEGSTGGADEPPASDVITVVDGKQIITITAKGSYSPRSVKAQGGIPTTLRMRTSNSYGCERAFGIPKMKITRSLPATGDTDIDLGAPEKGSNVFGTCSMGMYTVTINFN